MLYSCITVVLPYPLAPSSAPDTPVHWGQGPTNAMVLYGVCHTDLASEVSFP